MRESEKRILTLHAEPWVDPDGRVWAQIQIGDTGCGIPENELGKIWELTYSTKSSSGGYGLYRAKGVIESLGGYITVRSQVNAGTIFEIRLPGEPRARDRSSPRQTANSAI
jgi:signal transduction histidine kinase